jgi:hypothetical protein
VRAAGGTHNLRISIDRQFPLKKEKAMRKRNEIAMEVISMKTAHRLSKLYHPLPKVATGVARSGQKKEANDLGILWPPEK